MGRRTVQLAGPLAVAVALLATAGAARADDDCPEPAGELALMLPEAERCRPRPASTVSLRFGVEALTGATDRDLPLQTATAGLAVPVDVGLTPWLMVGARAQWTAVGDEGVDADGDRVDDDEQKNHHALTFSAGPRLLLVTNPARLETWRLEVSGGWMEVATDVAPSGPMMELAVLRQAGSLTVDGRSAKHGTGWEVALALRLQQGLGDASDYQALLLGASFATELFAPLPEGPRPRRSRPDVEYTFGGDVDAGVHFFSDSAAPEDRHAPFVGGVGMWAGIPFGTAVELRARGEVLHVGGPDSTDDAVVYAGLGGLRFGRWFPFFLEAYGGWAAPFGTDPGFLEPAFLGEINIGFQYANAFDCGVGFYAGHRVRFGGIARGPQQDAYFNLGFALGVTYDNLVRAAECEL